MKKTKVRTLLLGLEELVDLTETTKWKFYYIEDETAMITVEIPRGERERFEVIFNYKDEVEKANIRTTLAISGFIEQRVHQERNY